jgi:hypothetical protein
MDSPFNWHTSAAPSYNFKLLADPAYVPSGAAAAAAVQFLAGDFFPEVLNHKIVKPVFAVVVALLFIGPQVTTGSVPG